MIDMKISDSSLPAKCLTLNAAQQEKTHTANKMPSSTLTSLGEANHISPASRQLSEALQRAEQRENTLSREGLRQRFTAAMNELWPADYIKSSGKDNAQRPDTEDPDLLARARKATDFENGTGPNPFKGLRPELLTAIAYDDSGTFTLNERRAARTEAYDQHEAWGLKVIAEATEEYNRTGHRLKIYDQVLDHYKSQPLIEKAQFPETYEQDLITRRNEAIRLAGKRPAKPSTFDMIRQWRAQQPRLTTLFSMLAGASPDLNERLPGGRGARFTALRQDTAPAGHQFVKAAAPATGSTPSSSATLFKDLSGPAPVHK